MASKNDDGASWLTIAILIAIPGIRFIGVFMLIKKLGRMLHLSKKQNDLMYVIAAILLFGSAAEILSWIKGALKFVVLPVSALALAGVAFAKKANSGADRLDDYVSCIGDAASYSLESLRSEMGVSERKLKRDIRALRKTGRIPETSYIDEGAGRLILRPEGKTRKEADPVKEKTADKDGAQEYKEILLEIRALNVLIEDERVSEKIDKIEEITAAIFDIVVSKPERTNEIQNFLEYYLPTTLRLLKQYARLEKQSIAGENIQEARLKIEGILDKLVTGFEKQLDLMFRSDAIDITSDIKVLEKMMRMDGLDRS